MLSSTTGHTVIAFVQYCLPQLGCRHPEDNYKSQIPGNNTCCYGVGKALGSLVQPARLKWAFLMGAGQWIQWLVVCVSQWTRKRRSTKNRESFSECMNCEQCDPSKLAEPLASCSSPGFLLVTPSFLPSYGCHADSGKGEANDVDFKGTQTQRNYADTNHLGKNR